LIIKIKSLFKSIPTLKKKFFKLKDFQRNESFQLTGLVQWNEETHKIKTPFFIPSMKSSKKREKQESTKKSTEKTLSIGIIF